MALLVSWMVRNIGIRAYDGCKAAPAWSGTSALSGHTFVDLASYPTASECAAPCAHVHYPVTYRQLSSPWAVGAVGSGRPRPSTELPSAPTMAASHWPGRRPINQPSAAPRPPAARRAPPHRAGAQGRPEAARPNRVPPTAGASRRETLFPKSQPIRNWVEKSALPAVRSDQKEALLSVCSPAAKDVPL